MNRPLTDLQLRALRYAAEQPDGMFPLVWLPRGAAQQRVLDRLQAEGLITDRRVSITDKGRAYLESLK